VRVDKCARHVLENAHRFTHRHRSARQPGAQGFPFNERHDEEGEADSSGVIRVERGLPRAQDRHDVRMLKRRRKHDLALEALYRDGRGKLIWKDLDDDVPAQRIVAGDEDGRHAPTAELALEGEGIT
jgi:hypothetical protein